MLKEPRSGMAAPARGADGVGGRRAALRGESEERTARGVLDGEGALEVESLGLLCAKKSNTGTHFIPDLTKAWSFLRITATSCPCTLYLPFAILTISTSSDPKDSTTPSLKSSSSLDSAGVAAGEDNNAGEVPDRRRAAFLRSAPAAFSFAESIGKLSIPLLESCFPALWRLVADLEPAFMVASAMLGDTFLVALSVDACDELLFRPPDRRFCSGATGDVSDHPGLAAEGDVQASLVSEAGLP